MRYLLLLAFLFIIFIFYGLFLGQYQLYVEKPSLTPKNPIDYYDYMTITQVHSNISSGSGNPEDIVQSAIRSNQNIIFFTEVNRQGIYAIREGYYDNLLVLRGGEYNYLDSRMLIYNNNVDPPTAEAAKQLFFADLLSEEERSEDEGFLVLSHPNHPRYPWKGPIPKGLQGIEIVNLKSIIENAWRDSKYRSILSLLVYAFNPRLALLNLYTDPVDNLFMWDQINKERKIVAFMGTDAKAKAVFGKDLYLKFPSYETSFSFASNHILLSSELTGNFVSDRQKVMAALRHGSFYICLDILAHSRGFTAEVASGDKVYPMGSELTLQSNTKLKIKLPESLDIKFEVKVFKDGELFLTSNSPQNIIDIKAPGTYRAVVYVQPFLPLPVKQRWFPWIYTNAFYIK